MLECKQVDEENGNETNNKNSEKNHSKKEIDENGQNKHNSVKNPPMLKRKFLRCSSLATVTHLKKFIAKKVDILYSKDLYSVPLYSFLPELKKVLISLFRIFSYYPPWTDIKTSTLCVTMNHCTKTIH